MPVTPDAAPVASRVEGSLDFVSAGDVAFVEGWASEPDATLLLVTDPLADVINETRVVRSDAAAALGRSARPGLGFRLTLRGLGGPLAKFCVLARDPAGVVSVLRGSDSGWCPAP